MQVGIIVDPDYLPKCCSSCNNKEHECNCENNLKAEFSTITKVNKNDIFANAFISVMELEKMMVNSNPILGDFILKGQMSFIYGPPNSGKTLIIMSLLKNVKEDVIYLNADDGINGGTEKVKLAKENNYLMILCGTNDNNDPRNMIAAINAKIIEEPLFYKNKIIIFDTVKKFVDPLEKKASSVFLQLMRKITLSGGTVLLLGHTNKHRDNGDNLIFEGVGDWVSDMDCVYSLDFELNEQTNEKVIIFDNHKSRGVVPQTVSYKYDASKNIQDFKARLETVTIVSNVDVEYIKEQKQIKELESKYEDALLFIVAILKEHNTLTQSDIRKYAKEDTNNYCGSDSEIRKCLKVFEQIKWNVKTNTSKNNAKEYLLKV